MRNRSLLILQWKQKTLSLGSLLQIKRKCIMSLYDLEYLISGENLKCEKYFCLTFVISWRMGACEALRHPWLSDSVLHHRLYTKVEKNDWKTTVDYELSLILQILWKTSDLTLHVFLRWRVSGDYVKIRLLLLLLLSYKWISKKKE